MDASCHKKAKALLIPTPLLTNSCFDMKASIDLAVKLTLSIDVVAFSCFRAFISEDEVVPTTHSSDTVWKEILCMVNRLTLLYAESVI